MVVLMPWTSADGIIINVDAALDRARDDESPRDYIGASVLGGECDRQLWYNFRWWDAPDFPPRILRRFDDGHAMEGRVIEYLRAAGYEVHCETDDGEQYGARLAGGVVAGHLDGFVRGNDLGDRFHLLEVKIMVSAKYERDEDGEPTRNKRQKLKTTEAGGKRQTGSLEGTWFKLHRQGVYKAKLQHWAQMQVYMGASQAEYEAWGLPAPLTRALYVSVNGDTQAWHCELVDYAPSIYSRLVDRGARIAALRYPPERISENPKYFPCLFCDSRDTCHLEKPPSTPSCRSCRFASLSLAGGSQAWLCGCTGAICPGDMKACDEFAPIEQSDFMRGKA